MLVILIFWILILFTSFSFGFAGISLIKKRFDLNVELIPFDIICLFGLSVLGILVSIGSIFIPISFYSSFFVYTFSFAIVVYHKNSIYIYFKDLWSRVLDADNIIPFIAIIGLFFIGLSFSAGKPNNYDTGLYHAQMIIWGESYPAIFGLGNLHGRFAFNSHYFLLESLYQLSELKQGIFYSLNGLLYTMLLIRSFFSSFSSFKNNDLEGAIFYALITLGTLLFGSYVASSAGNDLVIFVLSFYTMIAVFKFQNYKNNFQFVFLTTLCFYGITVKLSFVPFIILPMGIMFSYFDRKKMYFFFLSGLLCLLPFFIRNVILSGYLLYPFEALDLFSFDWKIPIESVRLESRLIKCWARQANVDCDIVMTWTFEEWVKRWWYQKTITQQVVIALNGPSFLLYPLMILTKYRGNTSRVFLLLALLSSILFWFIMAPNFRFAFGLLILNASLTLAICLSFFQNKRIVFFGLASILVYFIYSIPAHIYSNEYVIKILTEPIRLAETEVKIIPGVGFDLFRPMEGDQCFGATLPCTPRPKKDLALRGPSIEDGFRIDNYKYHNIEARALLKLTPDVVNEVDSFLTITFYKGENKILYQFSDTSTYKMRFILHIYEEGKSKMEKDQEFMNLDFSWVNVEQPFEGKFYLVKEIPDVEHISRVSIGQYSSTKRIWKSDLFPRED